MVHIIDAVLLPALGAAPAPAPAMESSMGGMSMGGMSMSG